MTCLRRLLLPVAAMVFGTTALQAQVVQTIILNQGARTFPEPFSSIEQLVELRDGRVLLLDTGESALMLVDLQRNTASKVSRKGGGPLEYQSPGLLLGSVSDTIYYLDMMQARLLLLTSTAIPVATSPFNRGEGMEMLNRAAPTAIDAKGRMYGRTMGLSIGNPAAKARTDVTPTFADTVEIQRLDRNGGKGTTLARVRNPVTQTRPKVEMSGGAIKMTMTAPNFTPSDVWAVLPDGRIAILRDGVYRLQFVSEGGKVIAGPVIPYTPITVTAAEKKSLVDSMRIALNKVMAESRKAASAMASSDGEALKMPKMDINILEPATWAATKPAYVSLSGSPDGRLWVALSHAAGTRTARYDVLNGSGTLLAHVQLAAGERLVGLGRGTVYTIALDDDDLQTLRRYTLPPLR